MQINPEDLIPEAEAAARTARASLNREITFAMASCIALSSPDLIEPSKAASPL